MISTHILDTSQGCPAGGVQVLLEVLQGEKWVKVSEKKTNTEGRISFDVPRDPGTFRMSFEIDSYFHSKNQESFFLTTPVVFKVADTTRNYHVPLLVSPYGYTTYRGS